MGDFSSGCSAFGSLVQPFLEHTFNTMYQDSAQSFARHEAEKAFNRERNFAREMQSQGTSLKMSDLRRAGLSPAFLNGAMLATNPLPAHSSAPSLPAQHSPNVNIAEGFLMEAQAKNLLADSGNKEADTSVKKLEADRKKIENYYLPQLKQREILLQDGTLKLQGSQCHYTDEQRKNIAQQTINLRTELDKTNEEINKLKAETANIEPDTIKKWIDAYFETDTCKALINKYRAEANMSYEQAKDLAETRLARLYNLYTQGEINEEQSKNLWIENGQLGLDLALDAEYKETERKIDMWLKPLRLVQETITGFAPFVIARKSSSKADVNVNSHSTSNVTSNSTSNVTSTSKSENHNWNHTPNRGRRYGRKR